MAATSPLPRWAPTPSPSRPLWRWGGGTPDAGSGGATTGWSIGSVFAWAMGGARNRGAGAAAGGAASPGGSGGVCVPGSGCEMAAQVAVPAAAADAAAFLTWEDVRVTVAGGGGSAVEILDGVSGHARPGEVLAIMGPSGCGKTTLLDTLAVPTCEDVHVHPVTAPMLQEDDYHGEWLSRNDTYAMEKNDHGDWLSQNDTYTREKRDSNRPGIDPTFKQSNVDFETTENDDLGDWLCPNDTCTQEKSDSAKPDIDPTFKRSNTDFETTGGTDEKGSKRDTTGLWEPDDPMHGVQGMSPSCVRGSRFRMSPRGRRWHGGRGHAVAPGDPDWGAVQAARLPRRHPL